VVRLPCAPTECEVVLVRNRRDGDGLEPGNRVAEGLPEEAKGVVDGGMHRRCGRAAHSAWVPSMANSTLRPLPRLLAGPTARQRPSAFADDRTLDRKTPHVRQQMRWSRASVPPFLDVRTAVLNGTLEDAFQRCYPGFRPANDAAVLPAAA